ncbi:MAG: gephyrin-like molybdotransferase Glp [Candidatus Bathyarchaeia archaeon]
MSRSSKLFHKLVSFDEAKRKFMNSFTPTQGIEEAALPEVHGRISAEDIRSPVDIPPFDKSTMDGFALKAEDTFGATEDAPVRLKLVGSVKVGERSSLKIRNGECAAVPTGAPIPYGANACLILENTTASDRSVYVYKSVTPGENIMYRGNDVRKGDLLIRKGDRITPQEIGLLASVGLDRVSVIKKPRVAIVSTGNELVSPGDKLKSGCVYDVNAYTLFASVIVCGGEPTHLGIFPDEISAIQGAIEEGVENYDIVLVSGGTSVGAEDIMRKAIEEIQDSRIILHGIAVRPGKPTILAVVGNKPIFCLPGNPTSALVTFSVFVDPIIRAMSGVQSEGVRRLAASLSEKVFSLGGRHTFLTVTLSKAPDGTLVAHPIPRGSGAVTTFALADGFVEVTPDIELLEKGEKVTVTLFGDRPDL